MLKIGIWLGKGCFKTIEHFKSYVGTGRDLLQLRSRFWNCKRCLHSMELYALCGDMHEQGHHTWATSALKLNKGYYVPHLMDITKEILSGCDTCKRRSLRMKKVVELLSQFRDLNPFAQVCMDFIGPLEKTWSVNRYNLVLVDHNTQFAEAVAYLILLLTMSESS